MPMPHDPARQPPLPSDQQEPELPKGVHRFSDIAGPISLEDYREIVAQLPMKDLLEELQIEIAFTGNLQKVHHRNFRKNYISILLGTISARVEGDKFE